jgi:16S rRNA (uracil1498-N3)-methyltransferase
MRRFFVPAEQFKGEQAILRGPEVRHARNVLRLARGDRVVVFDGQGREYEARIATLEPGRMILDLIKPLPGRRESALRLAVAQGYLKDKKMDRLVRHLTELGVSRWIPFFARRCVALPDEKRRVGRYQRWQKLSLEALKQCRRSRPMTIDPVVSFEQVLDLSGDYEQKWIFYENDARQTHWTRPPSRDIAGGILILIGPEGGFDPGEITVAMDHGFSSLGLGPRILRAETAALAAAAIAQAVYGDMGTH